MTEHGGDIDKAINIYGGKETDWIDLSTGINPESYPIPKISSSEWRRLPTLSEISKLKFIIQSTFNSTTKVSVTHGSQIAIGLLPFIIPKKIVSILEPTYGDYRFSFKNAGFKIRSCNIFQQLYKSEIAVIVNPNNPNGKSYSSEELIDLSKKIELLIVDESFIEASNVKSIISYMNKNTSNIIVIKSFGKFYGLAGLRLGFILSGQEIIKKFTNVFGSWPVSKVSIKIASRAIQDNKWISDTKKKLIKNARGLDNIMKLINCDIVGGTDLFRLYSTQSSYLTQKNLAERYIWSRVFSYSTKWLRLGIPSNKDLNLIKDKLGYL